MYTDPFYFLNELINYTIDYNIKLLLDIYYLPFKILGTLNS